MTETILDALAGIVRCEHRKVAIIGAGLGRKDAPWGDSMHCFWAINEIPQPQFDRHWEMHPLAVQSTRELRWLECCPTPCYVLNLDDATRPRDLPDERNIVHDNPQRHVRAFTGVANAVQYPLERVLSLTGGRRYFTSTFSFQLAYALAEGFDTVGLFGVELYEGSARERTAELACLEYWLGVADGRGVKVTLGPIGLAHRPYLYGYHYHEELRYWEQELRQLREVIAETVDVTGAEQASPRRPDITDRLDIAAVYTLACDMWGSLECEGSFIRSTARSLVEIGERLGLRVPEYMARESIQQAREVQG